MLRLILRMAQLSFVWNIGRFVVLVQGLACVLDLYIYQKWRLRQSKGELVGLRKTVISQQSIIFCTGVLTQLSIVFGLFSTQAMGLKFATPTQWRLVLFFSSGLAAAQLLASPFIVESPAWLSRRSLHDAHKSSARMLWGSHNTLPPDCKD